ncbi:hypothetical protein PTTG_27600 [Puccinia triticina 1-1 BBBD Race 1]|uniref:Uncharacterized protein n=1 Tax=Puccinia triticina (isolate 1-1 / race 1 (BBBD)) TaxID=630390 RepID=A0A180GIT9_PUCT1|nr:hypothetical protein PTTG_27600 [Puccinia triticina 1-1 BBBD Race 1]
MEDPTAISISSDSSAPINTNASPIAPPSSAPGMDLDEAIAQPVPAPVGRSIRQLEREIFGRSLSPPTSEVRAAIRGAEDAIYRAPPLRSRRGGRAQACASGRVRGRGRGRGRGRATGSTRARTGPFLISNQAMINPTFTPPPAARASTPRVDPDHPYVNRVPDEPVGSGTSNDNSWVEPQVRTRTRVPSPIPFGFYDVDDYHRLAPHQVEALLDRRPDFGQYDQYRFAPQAYTVFYQELASAMVGHFTQYPAANALERDGRVQLFRFASRRYRAAMRCVPF